jgi:hypothetical protein
MNSELPLHEGEHGYEAPDCPLHWQDERGYEHAIEDEAVHPDKGHVAYVECRQKWIERDGRPWLDIEYRLKVRRDGRLALDWEIDTYNPAFGCEVGHLGWHGDWVVMIYTEKHDTFACSWLAGGEVRLRKIAYRWRVVDEVIEFCQWGSAQVERLALPDLQPLPALTGAEAWETGLQREG